MSTFASKNGFADRPPVLPPLALADMIAGLYGSNAVLIALREIEQNSGTGQVIDLPLLDPIFSILGPEAALYQLTKKIEPRVGSRSNNTAPRNVYETRDGRFIAISASIQSMAERLYRAIGRADMIDDPRFATNTDRVKNIDEADRPVAEFIKARTLAENLSVFEAAEVTAAPVYDIGQFIADPHVQARAIVTDLPDAQMGSVPMHAVVPRLSGTPGEIRYPAPALGEHNDAILGGLGFSAEALSDLRQRKVI
jgi:formyl-CoA transferase